MCPGIAVLGGGGGGGGGDGSGNGNGDGSGGGGDGSGDGAGGDGKHAPGGKDKGATAGEPFDVVTGRVFTLPRVDASLPGPLPFSFVRQYSSALAAEDLGLGYGWAHSLGFRLEVKRRAVRLWTDEGIPVDFPRTAGGGEVLGPWGWVLRKESWGYELDQGDGLSRSFAESLEGGRSFLLTAVADRCGNRVELLYDHGRLTEARDSVGRRVRFPRASGDRIAAVEVCNAASQGRWIALARYVYDDLGRLVSATDPEGFTSRYAYDERNLLTAHTDRVGLTFHYRYDREGRCVETWGEYDGRPDPSLAEGLPPLLADGITRARGIYHARCDYMPGGYREVATSRQVKQVTGNQHGLVDLAVEGGQATSATYDERGHLVSEMDPMRAVTSYERDARGRLLAQVDPLGRAVRYERDARGDVSRVVDPAGLATEIARDPRGLPVRVQDPGGATRSFAYDDRGLMTEARDATGGVTRMAYDAHGDLVDLIDPRGGRWQLVHDFFGRLTALTDPSGAVSRYHHSARGEVIAETGPAGATARYTYDGEERPVEITDAAGRRSRLVWGGFHVLHEVTDAAGRWARARYGREGEVLEIENQRGERHTFSYDVGLRLLSERCFDGRVIRYRHDPAGRETRIQPELGEPVDFSYDAAGQLVGRETEGRREEYGYDERGFVERVAGPDGSVAFTRDAMGRIVQETQAAGDGAPFTIDVTYDAEGRAVGRRTSLGHTLSLERAPDGRASRITLDGRHALVCHFDLLGREIARVLPGGAEIHSSFDPVGQLVRRLVRGPGGSAGAARGQPGSVAPRLPGMIADTTYAYDATGRLEAAHDLSRGRTTYRRDPAGRLLERIAEAGISEGFSFDATGNVLEAGPGALLREHGPGDRLLRRGDVTYHHDDQGRLVEKREGAGDPSTARVTRYTWDGRGLLRSVKTPDGRLVEFAYDAFARRIEKRLFRMDGPGKRLVSRTRFFWDRHVPVHEVRTRPGDPVVEERTYVFEGRSAHPLAHCEVRRSGEDTSSRWLHYVNDPLGTPERLLDERGAIAGELRLSAWGQVDAPGAAGAAPTPIRFLGQYADEETGLVYNRHRYYDPETGRFISPDPIGLEGGLNAFARGSDPTAEVDVFGKSVEFLSPAPASLAEQAAQRNAARARFHADPDLVARRAAIKEHKDKNQCSKVADEAKALGGGTPLAMSDADGKPLQSRDDSTGKPKQWSDHYVNEDKNGRVVDYDQGMAFDPPNARQKHVNAMFENKVVGYQPMFF
jgi:RHS repeat-associated protein